MRRLLGRPGAVRCGQRERRASEGTGVTDRAPSAREGQGCSEHSQRWLVLVSVEAMALVLHHSTLSGTAKLVLIGIANHDGNGGAWPAIATLGRYAGRGEETVRQAIKAAVDAEELRVEIQKGGNPELRDDRRPNRYWLLLRCPEDCDGTTQHRIRGQADWTPRPGRGQAGLAHGVQQTGPEPPLEPSVKSKSNSPVVTELQSAPAATQRGRSAGCHLHLNEPRDKCPTCISLTTPTRPAKAQIREEALAAARTVVAERHAEAKAAEETRRAAKAAAEAAKPPHKNGPAGDPDAVPTEATP